MDAAPAPDVIQQLWWKCVTMQAARVHMSQEWLAVHKYVQIAKLDEPAFWNNAWI